MFTIAIYLDRCIDLEWGQTVSQTDGSHLLQLVGLLDGLQDALLGRLLGLSAQQELVQDEVGLLKVKDDVKLADLLNHTPTRYTSTFTWRAFSRQLDNQDKMLHNAKYYSSLISNVNYDDDDQSYLIRNVSLYN